MAGMGDSTSVLLVALRPGVLSAEQVTDLEGIVPDMRVVVARERDAIEALLPSVRVAFGQFPRDLIERAGRLEWYQQWGAGADWLMTHPAAVEMPFVLTNASGVHAVPISEHVFALLLAFGRGLPQAVVAQSRSAWQPVPARDLRELEDATLLLVGAGAIGARVARLAVAFGMRVAVVRRDPSRQVEGVYTVVGPADLDGLLPEADHVVITSPLTSETLGMFGARQFAAMKSTAVLVNIGRGGIVREVDLVAALRHGEIAGAGLDVFEEEPLPAASALWKLDNVIITAHYSGATPRYAERVLAIFRDNLTRFVAGRELVNVVDKRAGY